MITEKEYIEHTDISHRKKFAQFFTPELISDYMANWVVGNKTAIMHVLEPAFGLGIFSKSLLKITNKAKITGYDADNYILSFAKANFSALCDKVSLQNANYLTHDWDSTYDAIICNPPYLKFHDYDNNLLVQTVNAKLGVNLKKFTNIYSLFLMKSLSQLKPGGRCAYIVPSEFLNADYGVEVKRYLLSLNIQMHFIIVDFEQNVFDGAITTACIILCENIQSDGFVRFSTVNNIEKLNDALSSCIVVDQQAMQCEAKWKTYYGTNNSTKYKHLTNFSNYAKVSRGIATGSNKFFSLTLNKAKDLNIPEDALLKCVCHCTDINKSIFTETDFNHLSKSNKAMYLFKGLGNETNENVLEYIRYGENEGVNNKYLCEKRNPWYSLEKRIPAPIWVSVFNRGGLKFVRNEANVSNLTTFHCMYVTEMFVDIDVFFSYLLTDTAYQIFIDNSRQYGNGLVKFEPNDLNNAKVVNFDMLSNNNISDIKSLYHQYKITEDKEIINQINDIFVSVYAN
jgi:adenine-specific DNA-methyltransferase